MIAERDGEVLGAALSLPDVNQCLVHMNGRLLPFGWAELPFTTSERCDRIRVLALGVKPQYQDLGIAAAFYVRHLEQRRGRPRGVWWGEMGWILETNEAMNRAMEGMGGKMRCKRYRIFPSRPARRLSPLAAWPAAIARGGGDQAAACTTTLGRGCPWTPRPNGDVEHSSLARRQGRCG